MQCVERKTSKLVHYQNDVVAVIVVAAVVVNGAVDAAGAVDFGEVLICDGNSDISLAHTAIMVNSPAELKNAIYRSCLQIVNVKTENEKLHCFFTSIAEVDIEKRFQRSES
ncbi:Hypothetical predicted protein [Octopus vulgaris]|uniref:Uncharacterized protein n=1 Tax=Octopus vulgaris TaxID=6645 RepID=A0AA36AG85_OCTVU|nr:Hypothetical predicted protein [Octopus vulgaris]